MTCILLVEQTTGGKQDNRLKGIRNASPNTKLFRMQAQEKCVSIRLTSLSANRLAMTSSFSCKNNVVFIVQRGPTYILVAYVIKRCAVIARFFHFFFFLHGSKIFVKTIREVQWAPPQLHRLIPSTKLVIGLYNLQRQPI